MGSTPIEAANLGPLVYEVGSLVFTQKNGVRLPGGLPRLRSLTGRDPVFTRGMEVQILPEAPTKIFAFVGQLEDDLALNEGISVRVRAKAPILPRCLELAYSPHSKRGAERRVGSTPSRGTVGL